MEEMQEIKVGETSYQFPNDMADEEIIKYINQDQEEYKQQQQEVPPEEAYTPFGAVPKEIEADALIDHQGWMAAAQTSYQMWERKPFNGSAEELSDWSRKFMSDFNYNIVDTGRVANALTDSDQYSKEAFLYMMDTFDNTNMSWQGAGNATRSILTDPTTYAGIGSLGLTTIASKAGSVAAKTLLKQQLKKSLGRTGVIAAAEGGIYAASDNAMRQGIEVDAGRKDERDLGELALATGAGVVLGGALGVGLDVAAGKIGKTFLKGNKKPETPEVKAEVKPLEVPEVKADEPSIDVPEGTPEVKPIETPKVEAPEIPTTTKVVADTQEKVGIRMPSLKYQMEATTNLQEMTTFAQDVAKQLRNIPAGDTRSVVEQLQLSEFTLAEFSHLKRSAQMAKGAILDELSEVSRKVRNEPNPTNLSQMKELEELHEQLVKLDHGFAYYGGLDQRARQEGLTKGEDLTYSMLREEGIPEEDLVPTFLERQKEIRETREFKAKEAAYDKTIKEKMASGDMRGALEEIAKKKNELNGLDGMGNDKANFWNKLNEFSIGSVFSVTTLQVNMVASSLKGLVMPLLRGLMDDPLEAATRAEVAASYRAMRSSAGAAWRAAKAGWRYEQALLTRDPERFLESGLSLEGRTGAAARFFIRATNATDEYLSQINYNSYIAGKAAHEAATRAEGLGLKGAKRKKYLEKAVSDALKEAYIQSDPDQLITPLVNKGKNLGLTGKKLAEYVTKEIGRDPDALRAGANDEALDYVRDILYKKNFSGEGFSSRAVKGTEDFMNKTPAFKWLTGQLFFRTPIRVFEEGIRMTPLAQYIAPNFLKDLAGKNGFERQLRARAESLAAFAMVSGVAVLYGEGRITGGTANNDWRQKALLRDSAEADPYTITLEDGSTWSYRFSDPIATPFKIIISVLERFDDLKTREAQGEFINDTELEKLGGVLTAASLGLANSIKDANLAAGFSNVFDALSSANDPEDRTGFWLKTAGDKMRSVVPSTLRKYDKEENPEMKAPADILQMIQTQILDPFSLHDVILTSKAYDHMGRVKTVTDSGAFKYIYSTASTAERHKGRSDVELYVDQQLVKLQEETGIVIRTPYKHSKTGDMDFRTHPTAAGDETLFDKWNRYYNESIQFEGLAAVFKSELPDGTFKHKAARVDTINSLLSSARDTAFNRMLAEEQSVVDKFIQTKQREAYTQAGLFDKNRKRNAPEFLEK